MNIDELNQYGEFALPLEKQFKRNGSCPMNGYLGEDMKVSFDEEGRLEFSTQKTVEGSEVDSKGVALSEGVLVKQTQKSPASNSYRLYSWNEEGDRYTFLAFDSQRALDQYYKVLKRFNASLCDDDISTMFQEMGLSFESVTQVLLNQERNPMDAMFEEEQASNASGSFVM